MSTCPCVVCLASTAVQRERDAGLKDARTLGFLSINVYGLVSTYICVYLSMCCVSRAMRNTSPVNVGQQNISFDIQLDS